MRNNPFSFNFEIRISLSQSAVMSVENVQNILSRHLGARRDDHDVEMPVRFA